MPQDFIRDAFTEPRLADTRAKLLKLLEEFRSLTGCERKLQGTLTSEQRRAKHERALVAKGGGYTVLNAKNTMTPANWHELRCAPDAPPLPDDELDVVGGNVFARFAGFNPCAAAARARATRLHAAPRT